jgi:hypothetical protein
MPTPADVISSYIQAKDGNRPYLMRRAFAEHVALEMVIKTDAISFPSSASGLDAIVDTLVRRFSHEFENVYTFCLASPPGPIAGQFSCDWLVGMSSKGRSEVRVGCGRYDWHFQTGGSCLVERLNITIEQMQVLSPDCLNTLMSWLSALPYPWCPAQEATASMPKLQELRHLVDYINRDQRP